MKKVTILLVLVALLASVFGTGAASANRLIRLDIYNDTGDTVYMKLEATVGDAYYYLTFGDTGDWESYTIETDFYKRTTWACGNKTTGKLSATSNLRLKFIACDRIPTRTVWVDLNGDGVVDAGELFKTYNYGEPTMEKVQYFKWVYGGKYAFGACAGLIVSATFRSPKKGLCYFRYRY